MPEIGGKIVELESAKTKALAELARLQREMQETANQILRLEGAIGILKELSNG